MMSKTIYNAVGLTVMLCLSFTAPTRATVHDIVDIVGASNVDLRNFQYFKNLPSQNPKTAAYANPFIEHFQKKKAVIDYFENLFFGNSPFTKESEIPFNPHFGRAWQPHFERKYGRRGERLIAMLGQGYSLQELRHYGAIPREYGMKYYPN